MEDTSLIEYEDESIRAVYEGDKKKAMMAGGEVAQRITDMPKVEGHGPEYHERSRRNSGKSAQEISAITTQIEKGICRRWLYTPPAIGMVTFTLRNHPLPLYL